MRKKERERTEEESERARIVNLISSYKQIQITAGKMIEDYENKLKAIDDATTERK